MKVVRDILKVHVYFIKSNRTVSLKQYVQNLPEIQREDILFIIIKASNCAKSNMRIRYLHNKRDVYKKYLSLNAIARPAQGHLFMQQT